MRCNSAGLSPRTRLWVAAVCIVVQALVAVHGVHVSGATALSSSTRRLSSPSLATATTTVDQDDQAAAAGAHRSRRRHAVLFSDTIPRLSVGIYALELNTDLDLELSDKFLHSTFWCEFSGFTTHFQLYLESTLSTLLQFHL